VYGLGQSHCSPSVRSATLADALIWVWRGYQPGEWARAQSIGVAVPAQPCRYAT